MTGFKARNDFCVFIVARVYSSVVASYWSTHCSPGQLQPESVIKTKNIIPHDEFKYLKEDVCQEVCGWVVFVCVKKILNGCNAGISIYVCVHRFHISQEKESLFWQLYAFSFCYDCCRGFYMGLD